MTKYRTIPDEVEIVEAEQFLPDKNQIPKCVEKYEDTWGSKGEWKAKTTNGMIVIQPGYWVVTDEDGLSCVMENDVFRTRYEEVEEKTTSKTKNVVYCKHANESPRVRPCDCPTDCHCNIEGNCFIESWRTEKAAEIILSMKLTSEGLGGRHTPFPNHYHLKIEAALKEAELRGQCEEKENQCKQVCSYCRDGDVPVFRKKDYWHMKESGKLWCYASYIRRQIEELNKV